MAPRPHNSGHHTIEACYTSQFEQHLRAVIGLPLGDPSMKTPAAIMYNILGEEEVHFYALLIFESLLCQLDYLAFIFSLFYALNALDLASHPKPPCTCCRHIQQA